MGLHLDKKTKATGAYVTQCKVCRCAVVASHPHRWAPAPYLGISHIACLDALKDAA